MLGSRRRGSSVFRSPLVCVAAAALAISACGRGGEPELKLQPQATMSVQQGSWSNGDFETGTVTAVPTGWTANANLNNAGFPGYSPAVPPGNANQLSLGVGGKAQSFYVTGANYSQVDPDLGPTQAFRFPKFGTGAARVNYGGTGIANNGSTENVNTLQQSMVIGPSDVDPYDGQIHVRFAYAPVLELPSHNFIYEPYYLVQLVNLTRGGTTLYETFGIAGTSGVPWNTSTGVLDGYPIQWVNWALADLQPQAGSVALGDAVQLSIVASGCQLGGHFGRIYVDGVGQAVPGPYVSAAVPSAANANSNLTYTLHYANGASTLQQGVIVRFATPPNTTFVSTSLPSTACTGPATSSPNTGSIFCTIGNLAPGAFGSFTVTVAETGYTGPLNQGNYGITALNYPELLGSIVTTSITAPGGSAAPYADINVSYPTPVTSSNWGQTLNYSVLVSNPAGNPNLRSGYVNVVYPQPANVLSMSWTCAPAADCVSASGTGSLSEYPILNANATVTYTMSVTMANNPNSDPNYISSANGQFVANVVSSAIDPFLSNNSVNISFGIGKPVTLTVANSGNTLGAVTSSPAGVSCGAGCNSVSNTFAQNTNVVLYANPVSGAVFSGWSGSCSGNLPTCTVAMTPGGAPNVTATFAPGAAAGPAASLVAIAGNGNQYAGSGLPFATPLTVFVADVNGNPVSGAAVTFSGPATGASVTFASSVQTTNAAGIARATAINNGTASGSTTFYNATAALNSNTAIKASFPLINSGMASTIVYVQGGNTSDIQQASVGAQYVIPLTALVSDASGNPVPGVTVAYVPSSTTATTITTNANVVTDAIGHSALTITAGTTANAAFTFTASVVTSAGTANVKFSERSAALVPSYMNVVSGTPQTVLNGFSFGQPLLVAVTDSVGEAIAGASITFTVNPVGSASGVLTPTTTPTTGVATTNNLGLASVLATANSGIGTWNTTAKSGTIATATATFNLTNDGNNFINLLSGSPQSTLVAGQFGTPIVVKVTDANGLVVPQGTPVTFSAPSSTTVPSAPSGLSPTSTTTDASGNATTSVVGNVSTVSGIFYVTVQTPLASNSLRVPLTILPGSPNAMTLGSASAANQNAIVGATFAKPLAVQVVDKYNNNVPNAAITFTAPTSGATAFLTAALPATVSSTGVIFTDNNGSASLTANANNVSSTLANPSYVVTAASGSFTPITFTLVNNPNAAVAIVLSPNTTSTPAYAATSTAYAPLSAQVVDSYGNAIPNVAVTFTAATTGLARVTVAGSPNTTLGTPATAAVTATANATQGATTVTVTSSGLPSQLFNLQNVGTVSSITGPAANSVVVGSSNSVTAIAKDILGNPVGNVALTFSATTSAGATSTFTPVGGVVTTDSFGVATIVATANTVATASNPNYTMKATSGAVSSTASAWANLPGSPNSIFLVGAPANANLTQIVAKNYSLPLEVLDAYGNIIPNQNIVVTAPAAQPSLALAAFTYSTSTLGTTAGPALAGNVIGSFQATATSAVGGFSQVFNLTNLADVGASLALLPNTTTPTAPLLAAVSTTYTPKLGVQVLDRFGNPNTNASVTFTVNPNTTAPSTGAGAGLNTAGVPTFVGLTAGSPANANVAALANSTPGAYSVTVTASPSLSQNFYLRNYGVPAVLTLPATANNQNTVVNTAFTVPLGVTVKDASGGFIPGAQVTFTGVASSAGATATFLPASQPITADGNGLASVTANANFVAGTYSVTAVASNGVALSPSITLTNKPGNANALVIAGAASNANQSAVVGTAYNAPGLQVQLVDQYGNGIANAAVTFASPGTDPNAVFATFTFATDSNGRVTAQPNAGFKTGTYQVTAKSGTFSSTFNLTNLAGAPTSIVAASGTPQSAGASSAFATPLTATVTDAYGNLVPNASVTFTANANSTTNASATLVPGTATTSISGNANTVATANANGGTYTVTATVGSASAIFTLTNVGSPNAIVVQNGNSQGTVVGQVFNQNLVVQVLDAQGVPVPGVAVAFAGPGSGASATFAPANPVTDALGNANVVATASNVSGVYNVSASVAGLSAPANFTLTNKPGVAAALVEVSGSPQAATVQTAYSQPLVAGVQDTFGNPVPHTQVLFIAPTSGPSAALASNSAVSDAGGNVTMQATALTKAGDFNVTASLANNANVQFALTNRAGPVVALVLDGTDAGGLVAQVNTQFAAALGLTAVDAFGNPVVGAVIDFVEPTTGPSAQLSALTNTTDASGHVQVMATANAIAGDYTIEAHVDGSDVPVTAFTLTNSATAPLTVALVVDGSVPTPSPQSTEVNTAFANPVVVQVLDANQNPVANKAVHFTAPLSGATGSVSFNTVMTDLTGQANVVVTANARIGTYDLVISVAGAQSSAVAVLTNTQGPAASIVAAPGSSPQVQLTNAVFGAPLVVTVLDAQGNPSNGQLVTWSVPSSAPTGSLSTTNSGTDVNGQASVIATAGSAVGSYLVTATVSTNSGTASVTFSLTNAGAAPLNLALTSGGSQSTTVNTAFANPLNFLVTDANGVAVQNANVILTVPSTGASAVAALAAVTDVNGAVSTDSLSANTVAGTYTVTATVQVGGVLESATPVVFQLTNAVGAPATITAVSSPSPTLVDHAFAQPLIVQVTDSYGNACVGAAVSFEVPATEPTARVSSVTALTDASGYAQVTPIAGGEEGTYLVSVTVGLSGPTPAQFTLTNLANTPYTIHLVSGGGQTGPASAAFSAPLVFAVLDASEYAAENVVVTFTSTPAGLVFNPATAHTNLAGHATTTVTAPAKTGTYTVTAAAPASGATTGPTATANLTATLIPTVTVLSENSNSLTLGVGKALELSAQVTSQHGVPTGSVLFLNDGKVIGTVTVDTNGKAALASPLIPGDVGTHIVSAQFQPTGAFEPSESTSIVTVVKTGWHAVGNSCAQGSTQSWLLVLLTGAVFAWGSRRMVRRRG